MIIAIDPGKTTGWFALAISPTSLQALHGQESDIALFLRELHRLWPEKIIVESFRIRPEKARSLSNDDLPAPRVIGAIEQWCAENKVELIFQEPSIKKAILPWLLDGLGWYALTRGQPHARDASRHMAYYIWKTYPTIIECVYRQVCNTLD
jgi:hypothetical protein